MGAALSRGALLLQLAVLAALAVLVGMPSDTPDWTPPLHQFRRALYPTGSSGLAPPNPSFTVTAGNTLSPSFDLPLGTVQVRLLAEANGLTFQYRLLMLGGDTGDQYYGDPIAVGSPLGVDNPSAPLTVVVQRDWDASIDLVVTNPSAADIEFRLSALSSAESPGQSASAQSVQLVGGRTAIQAYDWQVDGAFTTAGTPSVVQSVIPAGRRVVVDYLGASLLVIGGGAATTPQLQLVDAGVTVVKRAWYALQAVPGSREPFEVSGLGLVMAGTATWQWDRVIGANQFATLDMAGYWQL